MGWFTRTPSPPKPDPIMDICKSLAERPWEWAADGDRRLCYPHDTSGFKHTSGIWIAFATHFFAKYNEIGAWIGSDNGGAVQQTKRNAKKLLDAAQKHVAALVSRPRHTFTESANLLADAVKRGDEQAAYALADEILEHARGRSQ